jgi:hypothetical protein
LLGLEVDYVQAQRVLIDPAIDAAIGGAPDPLAVIGDWIEGRVTPLLPNGLAEARSARPAGAVGGQPAR